MALRRQAGLEVDGKKRLGGFGGVGGPMFVGMVLPKVIAGASAKAVGDEMTKVVAEYQTVCATLEHDANAFLRAFEQKNVVAFVEAIKKRGDFVRQRHGPDYFFPMQ